MTAMLEKKTLSAADLEAQSVLELPDRTVMRWALVYVNVKTGDINVLSFNDFNTCAQALNNIIAAGNLVVQQCHQRA
jgi:hypothetical protein